MTKKKAPDQLQKKGQKRIWQVTPEVIKEIEVLAGRGLTQEEMYCYFGTSRHTWYDRMNKYPEMYEAIKRGKAKTKSFVVGKLFEQCKKGNVSAIIFYLKTQHRWSEHSAPVKEEDDTIKDDNVKSKIIINTSDPVEAARIYQSFMNGDYKA